MGMYSQECRNIKLVLSYDGSFYYGWQKQKHTKQTVQEILETAISGVVGERVRVVGAGRTDSGAHAIRQVANFKTTNFSIPSNKFKKILNDSLPVSIRVVSSEEVPITFNARFSAKFRKYVYLVFSSGKSLDIDEMRYPFISRYSYIPFKKDWDLNFLKKASKYFLGSHDFLPISSVREYKSTVRFVKSFRVFKLSKFLVFSITANGFMYNMARGMVSVLLEAENRKDEEFVIKVLSGEEKNKPSLVPASGLYLHRVYY